MAIGVSFVPSAQGSQGTGATSPVSPLQQAIQFLSLRLPKVFGAGAISSPETMNAPGSAGLTGDASPDAFFRRLMQQAGQVVTPPAAPTPPSVTFEDPVPPPAPSAPVMSQPYQQAASLLSPVLARQPGSADALIQAIQQAAPPGQQKPTFGGVSSAQPLTNITAGQTGIAPAPQPTSPQPIPPVPTLQVPGRFPFGGGKPFGG